MNIKKIKERVINGTMRLINERRGWTTNRKIVVIESDDWGSIRMPSRKIYEKSLKNGYRVDLNPYERYDSLESEDDLTCLFETLSKFRDINGNHPQFTANSVVANPDFEKIKKSNNTEYHFETIDKTFASYPRHKYSLDLWYEGERNGVFYIQYHGREHFNSHLFMNALKDKKAEALWAMENKMGGSIRKYGDNKNIYVAASDFSAQKELEDGVKSIIEGLHLFRQLHQKDSKSYIATNYTWPKEFEKALSEEGVQYLQGSFIQRLPKLHKTDNKIIYHFLGELNKYNQMFLVRNVGFEPSISQREDYVDLCLKNIDKSFRLNKPAIISSHRLNYIGSIFEENRTDSLRKLTELLKEVQKKWPDVEFMNTVELSEIMKIDIL